MTHWLVIPKHRDGRIKIANAELVDAGSAEDAATHAYMSAVVLGPVSVFSPDATHGHGGQGGAATHLPPADA